MLQSRNIATVLLAVVLLLNQLAVFGVDKEHARRAGAMPRTEVMALRASSQPTPRIPADMGGRCNHGCHVQAHFLADVARQRDPAVGALVSAAPVAFYDAQVFTRPFDVPYRPPRLIASA